MKIYLICAARDARDAKLESIIEAEEYVKRLETNGHTVHYPIRDCDQTDDGIGLKICETRRKAMIDCDEVHVIWNSDSRGSHFDFGMAFALYKPIYFVNPTEWTPYKSYNNVLLALSLKEDEPDSDSLCPFGSNRH